MRPELAAEIRVPFYSELLCAGTSDKSHESDAELVPPELAALADAASAISTLYSVAGDAIKLLQLLKIVPTGLIEAELLQWIDAKIDDVAELLFDHETQLRRLNYQSLAESAAKLLEEVRRTTPSGEPLPGDAETTNKITNVELHTADYGSRGQVFCWCVQMNYCRDP